MYKIFDYDPYLLPFEKDIILRNERLDALKKRILPPFSNKREEKRALLSFASAYEYYGFHKVKGGYVYREYAPHAKELYLVGDFNDWNRFSHKLIRHFDGSFEIFIPQNIEGSRIKVRVVADNFDELKIPLYANYVVRNEDYSMVCKVYNSRYKFKNKKFVPQKDLFIYETHIGMAQDKEGVGTYDEFRKIVLPKIKESGYTAIQIMGIMEHPYYASFGYQVSNFFAPCSLFGTPDELKLLIDEAHGLGIAVLLDIVHAHACKNTLEGISMFDGSPDLFFEGEHPAWGTMIFDYDKDETLKFLLSNVLYYLKEFKFDGLRFDGVTSMLYTHNGLDVAFDSYDKYFSLATNVKAVNYLQLATEVAKSYNKNCILVSEDMSAMPGMCLPIKEGGIGFDYRLALGQPDLWIKLIKEQKDEDWSMSHIYYELSTRRPMEKNVGYAECHDQALVGDKTIIFRLIDKEMYWHMQKDDPNLVVERGLALYKNIYGITMALGGEGYLNFMGNEFGHPEWIDFPREGNGWSYKYARRQWHLRDDQNLKFAYLDAFNKDLIELIKKYSVLNNKDKQLYLSDNEKIIAFKKGNLMFVFSFNPTISFPDLFIPLNEKKSATLVFSSDFSTYGGHGRVKKGEKHFSVNKNGYDGVMIYLPNRSFAVYELK